MREAELQRLRRRLERDPADRDALRELCRVFERHGVAPGREQRRALLPCLHDLWAAEPGDRSVEGFWLLLLDFELDRAGNGGGDGLGSWWRQPGRIGSVGDSRHDAVHGYPLRVSRRRDRATMVWVPPGSSVRGRDRGDPEEAPAHRVDLEGFYLDRAPVSRRAFAAFLEATAFPVPAGRVETRDEPEAPVTGVTWREADAYARWVGGRLPSEAEYEKAMRGPQGWALPWGELREFRQSDGVELAGALVDRLLAEGKPGGLRRSPLGRLFGEVVGEGLRQLDQGRTLVVDEPEFEDASPFGLSGVASDRYDWCDDGFRLDAYAAAAGVNPRVVAAEGERRVIRRGSPRIGGELQPCTRRTGMGPEERRPDVGFRVAISVGRLPDEFPPPGSAPAERAGETPRSRPRPGERSPAGSREDPVAALSRLLLDFGQELLRR